MNKLILTLATLLLLTGSVSAQSKNKKTQHWFDSREWMQGASGTPVSSIDVNEFAKHYHQHPERWKTVFNYIRDNDLSQLPLGLKVINEDVKVNVQEYDTRETTDKPIQYEKHSQMIDVQYVVSGREIHGSVKVDQGTVLIPYSEAKDVAQYSATNVPYYIVSDGMFTIFFPDDIHFTNIGYGERTKVRKVVFKVRY